MDKGGGRTIKAVERNFEIIETLRERRRATVSEIAEAVDLTSSNVHHHLTTLRDQGYVNRTDEGYELSVRLLILGGPPRDRLSLFRTGREDIDRLARETGETARLVIERHGYGVTIYQSSGEHVDDHYSGLGHQETLHSTASGKVILAHMPSEDVANLIETRGLPEHTPNTITEASQLMGELETIRKEGIAFDREEHVEGRQCVAAPVFGNDERLLGSISISAPTDRKDPSWFESEAIDHLENAAGVIQVFNTYKTWMEGLEDRDDG